MPEAVLEKEICHFCGSDVRDGTVFCYNCGKSLAISKDRDVQAIIEPNESLDVAVEARSPREIAATERKKARLNRRNPPAPSWEEPGTAANRLFVVVTILIFALALAIVFLTMLVK